MFHLGDGFCASLNGFACVDDGAVIAPAKGVTNVAEGCVGELGAEVHGDLPCEGDLGCSFFAGHFGLRDAVVFCHAFLDDFVGDPVAHFLDQQVVKDARGGLDGDYVVVALVTEETLDGAFEVAHIAYDAFGEELEDFIVEFEATHGRLAPQDGVAGFQAWGADVGSVAPAEARDEAFLKA